MLDANAQRILSSLSAGDLVLDIGGWACPFNRANYILDAEPYETRGFYGRTALERQVPWLFWRVPSPSQRSFYTAPSNCCGSSNGLSPRNGLIRSGPCRRMPQYAE